MRAWFGVLRPRRLLALVPALALVGVAATVSFAGAASATSGGPTFTFGKFGTVYVSGTVSVKDVKFTTYTVDPGANCTGSFSGTNCEPQTETGTTQQILQSTYDHTSFSTGTTATCGYVQEDVYTGYELTTIGPDGTNHNGDVLILGQLVNLGPCSTPPVSSPPVTTPPVTTPPVSSPPVSSPVTSPPVTSPVTSPPVSSPVTSPPVTTPPVTTPPVTTPPVTTPPVTTPPVTTPPSTTPPPTNQAAPTPTATGTIDTTTCPADSSSTSAFAVTLTNTGTIAVIFQLYVNGVPSGAPTAAVTSGHSATLTGTLGNSTDVVSATVMANGITDLVTLMPGVVDPNTSSCVLGETLTNPPTVKPTTPLGVLPITVTKPQAAPPKATLPFTGIPTTEITLVAIGLLGLGGAILFGTRRRARHLLK